MIQLEINGAHETIDPGSIEELRTRILEGIPEGHVICVLLVNELEMALTRLDEFDLESIRSLGVRSQNPVVLARESLTETQEWIRQICDVLGSIARDYRLGREDDGANRLVSVVDALQVLVGHLQGIRTVLVQGEDTSDGLHGPWLEAAGELRSAIEQLVEDIVSGDPVRLADRTGHTLPASLGRFREVLAQISA